MQYCVGQLELITSANTLSVHCISYWVGIIYSLFTEAGMLTVTAQLHDSWSVIDTIELLAEIYY